MTPYFGTKVDRWKWAVGFDPNVMKDVSLEGSDEGDRVVVEINATREGAKEVLFDVFFLRDPEFFAAVIDDGVLMRVSVDGIGVSRSGEEIREEVD